MEHSIRYVGLDESRDSIEVAVAEADQRGEVRVYGQIPNTPDALRKLVRRLGGKPSALCFAYEAGPTGYATYHLLTSLGCNCVVVAPSKTPMRRGDRIKNDRRDAVNLARLHRAGELTAVWVPEPETEAMRDLTRAREDAVYAQIRARQRLGSFLLRQGRQYTGGSRWTKGHWLWIRMQRFEHPAQHVVLEEYVDAVEEASRRLKRLEQQIHELVESWSQVTLVKALMANRGLSLVSCATIVSELGDPGRFERARQLMGFVGLVPSLRDTGLSHRSGPITKAGNAHVRRVLGEAAWAYRYPARRTEQMMRRLKGQPPKIQELSWKGQVRLCGKFQRLRARGVHQNKIVMAVARELVGFVWATARMVSRLKTA